MAAAPLIMMGVGSAVSAIGAIREGNAAADAANYNANAAAQNALYARQQAAEEEQQVRIMGRKTMGSMRAAYGASGVTMEGSPMDVLAESAAAMERDALNVRRAGERRAQGFEAESSMERRKAGYAKTQGYLGAAGSLLSGGGNILLKRA